MNVAPDSSAVRTARWRALHVQVDAALLDAGFDDAARSLVSSRGVSMYITKAARAATRT